MFRLTASALPRLILTAVLFFGLPAFAQFEIAPDHFDSVTEKSVAKSNVKSAHAASSSNNARVSSVVGSTIVHRVNQPVARRSRRAKKAHQHAVASAGDRSYGAIGISAAVISYAKEGR